MDGRYMVIPIRETNGEVTLTIEKGGETLYVADIRLAGEGEEADYCVPLDLEHFSASKRDVHFSGIDAAQAWKLISFSDAPPEVPAEKYRPVYHHTPPYGWMNDANGLFYKDGVYHLYYQYNPFACVWGNMHWGHSTSTDMVHWEHQPVALYRDGYGHIFSGSSVVDKDNTAGFGAGAIVSFYTSYNTEREYIQTQCLAYSLDDGMTFTKYEGNPVLVPFDGIKDFRDPKVFWYEPESKWIMIVSADREMRFYSSQNLREWEYMSAWGEGYGVQPRQFECPDFFQLSTAEGETKWVMIVNVNPGCYFGGSATQYFVGEFDGREFTCDSPKETVKWLDWGKDHYATVCFSNTGDRVIAVPWMSNWQYGTIVPTKYFRSANAIPRQLGLFKDGAEYYVSAYPVAELSRLEKESRTLNGVSSTGIFDATDGAYELDLDLTVPAAGRSGFRLTNAAGDVVDLYFDAALQRFVFDRTKSGIVDFGERSTTHEIENHGRRKTYSMDYVNDFALATWAPMAVKGAHRMKILYDLTSLEVFIDGGRVAMTNLVFPNEPYDRLEAYSDKGGFTVDRLTITRLGL
ncbi:MAG: GH32 C-terminal domain-containing protein [Bacteroidales bacterium]|nr:GH32 C-terminal domain-containing protein [Bacteroidales bacterium]